MGLCLGGRSSAAAAGGLILCAWSCGGPGMLVATWAYNGRSSNMHQKSQLRAVMYRRHIEHVQRVMLCSQCSSDSTQVLALRQAVYGCNSLA